MSKKSSPCPTTLIPESFTVNLASFWFEAVPMQPDMLKAPGGCRCTSVLISVMPLKVDFFELQTFWRVWRFLWMGAGTPLFCSVHRVKDTFVFPGLSSTVCYWLELERWELLCVITRLNCWNCLKDRLYITLMAFITFSSEWEKKKAAECCTSLIKSHNYSAAVMR